jgi:hypothetical protein
VAEAPVARLRPALAVLRTRAVRPIEAIEIVEHGHRHVERNGDQLVALLVDDLAIAKAQMNGRGDERAVGDIARSQRPTFRKAAREVLGHMLQTVAARARPNRPGGRHQGKERQGAQELLGAAVAQ